MYGIDISSWQRGIDLSKGNYAFCIIKATEGTGYTNDCLDEFTVQLTRLKKLIGCYHFARPDKNNTIEAMKKEADYFVSVVCNKGLLGKAILCLDWETEPMDRPDLIKAWMERVKETTQITPFIYTSKSQLYKWEENSAYNFLYDYGIWMALWRNMEVYQAGELHNLKTGYAPKYGLDIWQYSSNGRLGDNVGNIDLNVSYMTKEEWESASKPRKEPISEDMQWAIIMDIFKGYPDGTFRENEPITRGQAATVIRRLYNMIGDYEHNT